MIDCRLARDEEAAACLALVPGADAGCELLIARRDGGLAGAAALAWRSDAEPPGFVLQLAVLPAQRRHGVGSALVAAAADLVRGETAGLWTLPLDADSDAFAFAVACGFRPRLRTYLLGAPLAFAAARLGPKVEAAIAAGGIAARAMLRPLAISEVDFAGALVSAELGGGPLAAAAKIRGLLAPANRVPPQVAIVDGALAAVVLCHGSGDTLVVEAMVVAPGRRGGHLSQLLMRHIVEAGMAAGLASGYFQSEEQVVTTFDILERAAGLAVPTRLRSHLAVAA